MPGVVGEGLGLRLAVPADDAQDAHAVARGVGELLQQRQLRPGRARTSCPRG